jgi:hypothetical protein
MQLGNNKVEHWKFFNKGELKLEGYFQEEYQVDRWAIYENGKTRSEFEFRKAYELKEEKAEEKDEEEKEKDEKDRKFFTDGVDLDEAELTALIPPHYYAGPFISDDREDISYSPTYHTLTQYFFDGNLRLVYKDNWQGDSAFVYFAFPEKKEISGLKYTLHTDADGLKLIPLRENYRAAANECAVFAETPSDWVEKPVLQITMGSKLKKEILREPSKFEWLVEHIEKNQKQELDKAAIAKALLTELYAP